jgi:glycosyltransferase involved in cell wall biosynthesis
MATHSTPQHEAAPVLASVLIPVLNEERHIRETVSAMQAQRVDGPVEFLFMDGRSEDATRSILEEISQRDPRVRVLDNPERRTAHGLNVGLAAARGEYVVRMDAHGIYPPDYIAAGVERLRRGDVDWVAGPAVPQGNGRWSRRVALALNSGLGVGTSSKWRPEEDGADDEHELDTGVWAGVWRRDTLERLGGWDTGWPINQDSELAARVLDDGGRIVLVPRMAARYFPRDALDKLARQYLRYGYYRAKTARRHPRSIRRSHALPVGLALAAPVALAAPRPLRGLARLGLAAYGAVLGTSALRAAGEADARDAAALPVVFAVMHFSWGYGYLWHSLRHGPPLAAIARAVRGG